MILIGLVGKANSGKDTLANFLVSKFNFKKLSFASSLKDAISVIFNWDRTLLEGDSLESREWRETIDTYWNLTPRQVLQKVGTNLFRNHFDKDIWIKSLINKIKSFPSDSKLIITDCRFINEIQSVKDLGGFILRVNRENNSLTLHHESENDIEDIFIDFEIENDGEISDLYDKVDLTLKTLLIDE
jgi:hypothetical protein